MELLNLPVEVVYHTYKFNFDTHRRDIPIDARAIMLDYKGKEYAIIKMIECDMAGHGIGQIVSVKCTSLTLRDGTRVKSIKEMEEEDRREHEKHMGFVRSLAATGEKYDDDDDDDDDGYWWQN